MRRVPGAHPHESLDLACSEEVLALVGRASAERALERLEVRLHICHARPGADRLLDALGDLVRRAQVEIGWELEVQ